MLTLPHQQVIKFVEDTIRKQRYGQLTITVVLKKGVPVAESARIVSMKRKKYKQPFDKLDVR